MNRYAAAALAVATGTIGFFAAPKPVPYTLGREIVTADTVIPYPNSLEDPPPADTTASATCPTGKVVTGGGYTTAYIKANWNYPVGVNTWRVKFGAQDAFGDQLVTVYAVCVNP
jgi:hypothetical protein